ncbi:hypothetical protein NCAS_0G00630 [Naumovozyma castellii]|uniref:TOM6 n=1 Tax=Naumovozyma castellii TaxID=27288 RepID=G0VHR6_NAUCA|nr:hypothetical protein NCAS_0G00630 [Naumovozyma castellii CBS 4309]CCC70950.1 hypothetical protein NCAS_0G00630 [Naumovozyma castellii CBS 4309]
MSAMFGMPGLGATGGAPTKPKSRFEQFRETPVFTVLLNGTLFVAGVAFIQSPLMDMLAPQL